MKVRNLLQASPPKAQKRQGVCLFECAGLRVGVFRLKYIGDFGLKWPPL